MSKFITKQFDTARITTHLDMLKQLFSYIKCKEYCVVLELTGNNTFKQKAWTKIKQDKLSVSQIHELLVKSEQYHHKLLTKATRKRDKIESTGQKQLIKLLDDNSKLKIPISELYKHSMKELVSNIDASKKSIEAEILYYNKQLTILKMQCEIFNYFKSDNKFAFPALKIVEYFEQSIMSEIYNDNTYELPPLSQHFRNVIDVTHAKEVLDIYTVKVYQNIENLGVGSRNSVDECTNSTLKTHSNISVSKEDIDVESLGASSSSSNDVWDS